MIFCFKKTALSFVLIFVSFFSLFAQKHSGLYIDTAQASGPEIRQLVLSFPLSGENKISADSFLKIDTITLAEFNQAEKKSAPAEKGIFRNDSAEFKISDTSITVSNSFYTKKFPQQAYTPPYSIYYSSTIAPLNLYLMNIVSASAGYNYCFFVDRKTGKQINYPYNTDGGPLMLLYSRQQKNIIIVENSDYYGQHSYLEILSVKKRLLKKKYSLVHSQSIKFSELQIEAIVPEGKKSFCIKFQDMMKEDSYVYLRLRFK